MLLRSGSVRSSHEGKLSDLRVLLLQRKRISDLPKLLPIMMISVMSTDTVFPD